MEKVLYDAIGTGYNQTRQADPFIAEQLYKSVFSKVEGLYLDIGCGTGNYTLALKEKGLRVCGIDPSEKMLEKARMRDSAVEWKKGKAENIPADDNLFDGIFGTLTLHHWSDIVAGFKELYRVLKPGGRIAFFTSDPLQMQNYWLNHYFPEMLSNSISQMPAFDMLKVAAESSGFTMLPPEKYFIRDGLKDHFLYVGKNRPELYFDETIRNGISSFTALSNITEVEKGLLELKADIDTGGFEEIKNRYDDSTGDYIFFKAQKGHDVRQ